MHRHWENSKLSRTTFENLLPHVTFLGYTSVGPLFDVQQTFLKIWRIQLL
jgi:hypothetical protein